MNNRTWIAAGALAVIVAGCGSGDKTPDAKTDGTTAQKPSESTATSVVTGPENLKGKPVPAFSFNSVNTNESLSDASLKGKVVVLDFWATWCGPCKAASPYLDALQKKYGKDGLVVIGANGEDPVEKIAAYPKEHKYSYAFAQASPDVKKAMQIENLPAFIFVGRDGVVERVDTGFQPKSTPQEWDGAVQGLLAKK